MNSAGHNISNKKDMNVGGDLFKETRGSAGEVGTAGGEGGTMGKGYPECFIYFMYIHEIIKVNSSAKTSPAYGVVRLAQKRNEYQGQQNVFGQTQWSPQPHAPLWNEEAIG